MSFYIITISCIFTMAAAYFFMTNRKNPPPLNWGDNPYSKSRFAKWVEKHSLFNTKVDLFHLIGFYIHVILTFISIIILVIDIVTNKRISEFLGKKTILIITVNVPMSYILYDVFLILWWDSINLGNDPTTKNIEQLKKAKILKQIEKTNRKKHQNK